MRVKCRHGYFIFEESKAGQIADFGTIFDFDLVPQDDHFTFSTLAGAPKYSILGKAYLDAVTTKTFEGHPSEVMRANGLIYNFETDEVVPISTVLNRVTITQGLNYFLSPGLILPGSIKDDGSRVTDYSAWFSRDTMQFKYSDIEYE